MNKNLYLIEYRRWAPEHGAGEWVVRKAWVYGKTKFRAEKRLQGSVENYIDMITIGKHNTITPLDEGNPIPVFLNS